MSELIILSNRVSLAQQNPQAGGVAVAIHDLLSEKSGVWMGWNGEITQYDAKHVSQQERFQRRVVENRSLNYDAKPITLITTFLSQQEHQRYYSGYANSVLWPLLHEQRHLMRQHEGDYECYQAVNRVFAQQLCAICQPDDVIWVHDYHFLSVAYYCRALGMTNRIGFFLHIPFANWQYWSQIKQSRELITHLAHYDVLGLQTQQDKSHCVSTIEHFMTSHLKGFTRASDKLTDNKLILDLDFRKNHELLVEAYPVGVNVERIQRQARTDTGTTTIQGTARVDEKSFNQRIVAVDRIEPAKGLLERVQAYAAFLRLYPNYQQQLNLCQIACPSRGDLEVYQTLNQQLKNAISQVNREFSATASSADTVNHHPIDVRNARTDTQLLPVDAIDYTETVLSRQQLMQLFARSDVGWINSIKDGMNLVAKEYVAAQNPHDPGVLLLSCHAGASEQMQDAIIIDPLEERSVVAGLHQALTMSLEERQARHLHLLSGLGKYDLESWQREFLTDLYGIIEFYRR